jgi:ATP-binding protein involved in chromosome partitioning
MLLNEVRVPKFILFIYNELMVFMFGSDVDKRKKEIEEQEKRIKSWMAKIKHKIVILSGKGGVGKSTLAANLAGAIALKDKNASIGILDADITGPSIPKILGARDNEMKASPIGIAPVIGPNGIRIISMDFLLQNDETPVIWRGPMKSMAIRQFLADVMWGSLDYLIIDLPPGTGDEALSIMQLIPDIDGVIIVTIPSDLSQIVVKKAVTFTRQLKSEVIGIVENMSGLVCPKCGNKIDVFQTGGGKKISNDLNVPFITEIPLDPRISEDSDKGVLFVERHPDSPATKAYTKIVKRIDEYLEKRRYLK